MQFVLVGILAKWFNYHSDWGFFLSSKRPVVQIPVYIIYIIFNNYYLSPHFLFSFHFCLLLRRWRSSAINSSGHCCRRRRREIHNVGISPIYFSNIKHDRSAKTIYSNTATQLRAFRINRKMPYTHYALKYAHYLL